MYAGSCIDFIIWAMLGSDCKRGKGASAGKKEERLQDLQME